MDVDINAMLKALGGQLGAQQVQITHLQMQLDLAQAELTRLKGEAVDAAQERNLADRQ